MWEIKPPCGLRKSGVMLGWDRTGKSPVVPQPWARPPFPPQGNAGRGWGTDRQFWHWICAAPALCPWQLCLGGKQTGPPGLRGQWESWEGEAVGGERLQGDPWEEGKPQQSTVFSPYCQAGTVQGQYISPSWQLWQTVQAWLVQSPAQGLAS